MSVRTSRTSVYFHKCPRTGTSNFSDFSFATEITHVRMWTTGTKSSGNPFQDWDVDKWWEKYDYPGGIDYCE